MSGICSKFVYVNLFFGKNVRFFNVKSIQFLMSYRKDISKNEQIKLLMINFFKKNVK